MPTLHQIRQTHEHTTRYHRYTNCTPETIDRSNFHQKPQIHQPSTRHHIDTLTFPQIHQPSINITTDTPTFYQILHRHNILSHTTDTATFYQIPPRTYQPSIRHQRYTNMTPNTTQIQQHATRYHIYTKNPSDTTDTPTYYQT